MVTRGATSEPACLFGEGEMPLQRDSTPVADWRPRVWPWGRLRPASYDVVVVDFPWRFILHSDAGEEKSAQAHYDCMSLEKIQALPVKSLCRPNALVFVWATWPMLTEAMETLEALGFTYVTGGSWAKRTESGKLKVATGYVIRGTEEPFLIGVDDASEPFLVGKAVDSFRNPTLRNHIDGLWRGRILCGAPRRNAIPRALQPVLRRS